VRTAPTHGWHLGDDDQVLVISCATPAGTVLGIRPTFSLGAPPANSLTETIEDTFAGPAVGGARECPQTPEAWTT
jgi:hypothetical protein